jgi:hypothetical protein
MALTQTQGPGPRRPSRVGWFWYRLHFLIRLLGVTGLLVAVVGLVLARQDDLLGSWQTFADEAQRAIDLGKGPVSVFLVLGGAAAFAVALLVELLLGLGVLAGRRSALGANAVVQIVLATALLVVVNAFSAGLDLSEHSVFGRPLRLLGRPLKIDSTYRIFDWTRDKRFTLPDHVRDDLAQLKGETTVVVYQRHKTFGGLTDKPDRYDFAAERKVVEKVYDLVEQLREVGPQFKVVELDVEDDGFDKKLTELTAQAPLLRKAIETAPENSIFFHAVRDRGEKGAPVELLQRLSFNDFYLLDKTSSQLDGDGKGNLVLLYQGVEPFARRVLSMEERPPRIGIAVIHEVLTTLGQDDLGLRGLRKALEARGFEVRDIVLKKWSRFAPPEGAAYTAEESMAERLDERETIYKLNVAGLEKARGRLDESRKIWEKATTDEKMRDDLSRQLAPQLRGRKVTAELARRQVEAIDEELEDLDEALKTYRQRLADVGEEKGKLNLPALAEQRRMTDLRAKTDRLLEDCDLLIVPRLTLRNTASDFENIPARLYRLDDAQVEAVKEFLKKGKPVLACFGPINQPEDERRPGEDDKPDGLESLLGKLGIKFGKQTVLFDAEVEAFADRRSGLDIAGTTAEVPPLQFEWKPGAGYPLLAAPPAAEKPNPLHEGLRLIARGLGKDRSLELKLRHPRPIYYERPEGVQPEFDAEFLLTSPKSWNEDQPFPTQDRIPQFEKPKPKDGAKPAETPTDPLDARRRGPFPIGVALETKLPADWYDSPAAKPATVRVAAIGQGGFFTGKDLPPAQEVLMTNTVNWLLGRDDYLPNADHPWSYPRVDLPDKDKELWLLGARVGLPVLFAYLGFVVLLARRVR